MQSGVKVDIMAISKVNSYFQSEADRLDNANRYRLKDKARRAYLSKEKKLSKVRQPLTNDTE
jgi:hypothetical protein